MRLLAIFWLILNSLFAFTAGAVSCEISTAKDKRGNPRIYKIQFPDGRRLSLIGQHHTDRVAMWEMLGLPAGKNLFPEVERALTTENSLKALPLLEEEREYLRHAVKNEGAKFIGVEMANERVGEWSERLRQFQDRALRYSARSGNSQIELISKARIAAYGAPFAMKLEEPSLLAKAPLYGFEDREAVKDHNDVEEVLPRVFREAVEDIGDDKEWLAKLKKLPEEMMLEQYPLHDPEAPKDELLKPLLAKWPGKYRTSVRRLLLVYLYNFDLMFARDNFSGENILQKNESGIIFIGAAHAKPIMLRLREACLKKQMQSEDLTSSIPVTTRR